MKKYIKPAIDVITIKDITLLTTSTLGVNDTPYDGNFDSRSDDINDYDFE